LFAKLPQIENSRHESMLRDYGNRWNK
jgi:hypothetical protein